MKHKKKIKTLNLERGQIRWKQMGQGGIAPPTSIYGRKRVAFNIGLSPIGISFSFTYNMITLHII